TSVLRTDVLYSEGPRCTLNLGKTYRRRAYIHSPLEPSRNIACGDITTAARPGLSGESCTSDGGFPSRIPWNRTCLATETQAGSNSLTTFDSLPTALPPENINALEEPQNQQHPGRSSAVGWPAHRACNIVYIRSHAALGRISRSFRAQTENAKLACFHPKTFLMQRQIYSPSATSSD